MDKITITYKVITPIIMGGANHESLARLRIPSIKGALRFWYRAIDCDYRAHEMRIFGGTDQGVGQSQFLLRFEDPPLEQKKMKHPSNIMSKAGFLAYGVQNRPVIESGAKFTLQLLFKPGVSDGDKLRVKRALWALTMFGGLGAKSRKGFGSITPVPEDSKALGDELPELCPDVDKVDDVIRAFVDEHVQKDKKTLPEHTCWSEETWCVVSGTKNTHGTGALEWLKDELTAMRSAQSKSKDKFWWAGDDCKKVKNFTRHGTHLHNPPLRAAFGLPHNYYFPDLTADNEYPNVEIQPMENNKALRRASPLLFRIYEKQSNQACVIATFFPARLLPPGAELAVESYRKLGKEREVGTTQSISLPDTFRAITDVMKKLQSKSHQGRPVTHQNKAKNNE